MVAVLCVMRGGGGTVRLGGEVGGEGVGGLLDGGGGVGQW